MKTHPLFTQMISASYYPSGEYDPHGTYNAWIKAGCPVVEEEPKYEAPSWPFWMGSTVRNLTGNINMDAYPELRRAIVEAVKREDDLAAANERIKELEACNDSQMDQIRAIYAREEQKDARIKELEAEHSPGWWLYVAEEHDKKLRNAALDDAIGIVESTPTVMWEAARKDISRVIRAMKK